MTVETQNLDGTPVVKSGPYLGNGVTATFDYDFPITTKFEVSVVRQNADLTEDELTVDVDYTVAGVGDEIGGSITLLDPATALPTGTKLVLLLDMDFNQTTNYSNQGRIQLELLETSLDRLTLMTRQLREQMLRTVSIDVFDTTDLAALQTNIDVLSGLETELGVLAAIPSDITSTAAIAANISTVAGIAANIATVAGDTANIATLAAISADVTAAVAMAGDISAVVTNLAAIQTAATAINGATAFALTLLDDTSASAMRDTLELGDIATSDLIDEDSFATDSAARAPSQQSTKAYVDAQVGTRVLLTRGTTLTTTSGTTKEFLGLPAGVKRIQVMPMRVTTSGNANILVQLGTSAGWVTTGYYSSSMHLTSDVYSTTGFVMIHTAASAALSGIMTLVLGTSSSNTWAEAHSARQGTTLNAAGGGDVSLPGVVDRVRLTTEGGTQTFVSGNVNIQYEV